jgi:hypothetical protein
VISDDDVGRALDWLVKNAAPAAKARADVAYLEEYRKSLKAKLMASQVTGTVASIEAYAYSHKDYLALLDGYKEAVRVDTEYRWLQASAMARIDAWRTLQSNARIQAKVG